MASAIQEISMLRTSKTKISHFILAMMLVTGPKEEVVVIPEVIVVAAMNGVQGVLPELVAVLLGAAAVLPLVAVLCPP